MIRGGDEFAHTQQGNNNGYCQDNEISWLAWKHDERQKKLFEFVSRLIHLKREQPVFSRPKFFQGRPLRGSDVKDIYWRDSSGREMSDEAWHSPYARCFQVHLAGDAIPQMDEHGETLFGDTMLLLFNQTPDAVPFTLPEHKPDERWELIFDTAEPPPGASHFTNAQPYPLRGRSIAVFRIQKTEVPPAAG